MELRLDGKLAMVTGATGALGQSICEALSAAGARILLVGRDSLRLAEIREQIGANFADCVVMDLGDQDAFDAALDHMIAKYGVPDILVAAAGSTPRVDVNAVTAEHFLDAVTSKLLPNVRAVLGVGRHMSRRGSGHIVVLSGAGGVQPMRVHLAGGATNAALSLFAVGYARHLIESGVRLNVINPGAIESPRLQGHFAASEAGGRQSAEQARAVLLSKIPLGRVGTAKEVASAVLFMVSDASAFIVATSLEVDGGQVIGP